MNDKAEGSKLKKPRFDLFKTRGYTQKGDGKRNEDKKGERYPNSTFAGKYNKCSKDRIAVTEKWFEERLASQRVASTSPINTPDLKTEVKHMTLDELETEILKIKHKSCGVCNKQHNEIDNKLGCTKQDIIKLERCCHQFCSMCIEGYQSFYNRCPVCSRVINLDIIEEYEGGEIIIPSYNNFQYYYTDFCYNYYNEYDAVY